MRDTTLWANPCSPPFRYISPQYGQYRPSPPIVDYHPSVAEEFLATFAIVALEQPINA